MKSQILTKSLAIAAMIAVSGVSFAQEAVTVDAQNEFVQAPAQSLTIMLDEKGSLNGNVFVSENETAQQASKAKVTLSQDGVVIGSVDTDEKGNFSFANVEPGAYQMMGAANPYVGQSSFNVVPYNGGASTCNCNAGLGMSQAPASTVYSSYSSAPMSSFGGGGFGGGGGVLGGRRFLRLGLIGGGIAIAIAAGDDDVDDASEDE